MWRLCQRPTIENNTGREDYVRDGVQKIIQDVKTMSETYYRK